MGPTPKRRSRKQSADTPRADSPIPIVLVGIVAFIVRAVVAAQLGAMPLSRTPTYDALEYLMWARQLAAGVLTWPTNPPHGPAYPFFLGGMLALSGGSVMFARIAQSFAGAATCCIAGLIASRAFGHRAGIVTSALLALYAPLVWIDVSIASEGLLMLLIAAAMWCATTSRNPILTGALVGLAALTRPTALIFLPLFAWIGGRTVKQRVAMVLVAIITIVPVTIANWRASHAFIPIQAFGGMNLYLGNSPSRDGAASARPGGDWERIEPEAARNGAMTLAAEDRYFVAKTIREVRAQPAGFIRVLLRKMLMTFQNDELRDTHSFYFFREHVALLRWLPGFTVLFALAAAGAFVANWRDRNVQAIAIYIALAAATSVMLVAGARYRMPLILGLAILAGAVAQWSARPAVLVVAAVAAAAFTRIGHDAASRNVAEEWALTAVSLINEGQANEAEEAAKRAIGIDPSSALAWDKLGTLYAGTGRPAEAEQAFRRAVSINPDYSLAHEHLGLILAQMGNVPAAADEFRRAATIDPRSANALFGLARLSGALGRTSEGLRFALRASQLRPPDEDEWIVLAMLAAEARRPDVAEDALQHVSGPQADVVRERIKQMR